MNTKKIIIFIFAVIMSAAFAHLNAAAAVDFAAVSYSESHENFEEAFGLAGLDGETVINVLTISGTGTLTKQDCDFITGKLTVSSLILTDLRFENETVPAEAFKNYGHLQSIALPANTASIAESAFEGCFGLLNFGISVNLNEIGARAFGGCASLENFALTGSITKIGENAFQWSGLKGIAALRYDASYYNAAENAFAGLSVQLAIPAGASGYNSAPFDKMSKSEWIFHKLPGTISASTGTTVELSADVTTADNKQAEYQWFFNGRELGGMTGDTLVITNLTQEASGRYGVRVSADGVSVVFAASVISAGMSGGVASYETKNTAPARTSEPERNKYDYASAGRAGGAAAEIKIELTGAAVRHTVDFGRESEYIYEVYIKKAAELYAEQRNGYFDFILPDSARLEIPFSLLNSRRSSGGENLLRIVIKRKSGPEYGVMCGIYDEDGKSTESLSLILDGLPPVYMYYPINRTTENYLIIMVESDRRYPVPSAVTAQNMRKFRINSDMMYTLSAPGNINFNDIKDHWSESEILNAARLYITEGYPDRNFQPELELTRAEFTAMLTRVITHAYESRGDGNMRQFNDIQSEDWFYGNVQLAFEMGLLDFITDSRFLPQQAITREEMAYMIAKAYSALSGSTQIAHTNYTDQDEIAPRFLESVRICTNAGLLRGAGGAFMPKKTLTRAEAAAVLNRLFNLLSEEIS